MTVLSRRDEPVEALGRRRGARSGRPSGRRPRCARPRRGARCTASRSTPGARARRRGGVERHAGGEEAARPAEHDHARVQALAALDGGDHAHHRVLERARRHGGPPRPPRRTPAAPRAGGTGTRRSRRATPARATPRAQAGEVASTESRVEQRGEPDVRLFDRAAAGQQDVGADRRERAARLGRRVRPGVLAVERGAVVDQPQAAVPDQQVGVLRRAVDVGGQRIEPDDRRGQLRVGRRARGRRVGERAGQEVEPDVAARARAISSWISGSGSARAELRVDLHEHDLGHRQPDGAGELAGHDLGHQRLRPLARRRGT